MLEALRRFLSDVSGDDGGDKFAIDDHRVAAAALLINLLSVDGTADPREQAALHDILQSRFGLGESETSELIEAARRREAEAVDLYGLTSVLKRSLDEEGRAGVIEMMWEIVFADGAAHELEDSIVWRAADLLGVPDRERVELKRRIAGRVRPPLGEPA